MLNVRLLLLFMGSSMLALWRPAQATMIQHGERMLQSSTSSAVYIAGLFDIEHFDWAPEIFEFTMELLNDSNNGWHDDVFKDGKTLIEWDMADSACDATTAARAYWDLRAANAGPPHAIVGGRCSSASSSIARIAGLEGVSQVSPSATSRTLSDTEEFPYFARTVSPDEAKAMVAMLRLFGWDRVTILSTDTQFSKDMSTTITSLWVGEHKDDDGQVWEGEIAYSHTIILDDDGTVNNDSVRQALDGVPTEDPTINSRVILLLSHDQHAYPILKIATDMNFQPDTIWVGPTAWTNRPPSNGDASWMSHIPGYFGVTPFRNRNEDYQDYLQRLQTKQQEEGRMPWTNLPDYSAEYMVDSIIALAMALSSVPEESRRDGNLIISQLLNLTFAGVSGDVGFTSQGDRRDPLFTIFNLQNGQDEQWVDIGSVGTVVGSATLNKEGIGGICFPVLGCDVDEVPSDKYPVPKDTVDAWVIAIIVIIVVLLLLVTYCYCKSRQKNKKLESRMEAMKKIDNELLSLDQTVENAKKRQESLILKRMALQDMPETWSDTKETLVLVHPDDEQYWDVLERMRETMPDAHVSKLWRVQNTHLWTYYSFHKERLGMHKVSPNERKVWHGTSSLEPSVIYNDQQDGFMMQFAAKGLWGTGIYFADKASYSFNYSYAPSASHSRTKALSVPGADERPGGTEGELEMFLAKLLVGNETCLTSNRDLRVPPTDKATNLKYNTVAGHTNGSKVWIVYENGRAYPDYLVRYYRGDRDRKRSPYKSRREAMKNSTKSKPAEPESALTAPAAATWSFLDNDGWKAYDPSHQSELEKAYLNFKQDPYPLSGASNSKVHIKTDAWTYEVDVNTMVQENVEHSDRKKRKVKRSVEGTDV